MSSCYCGRVPCPEESAAQPNESNRASQYGFANAASPQLQHPTRPGKHQRAALIRATVPSPPFVITYEMTLFPHSPRSQPGQPPGHVGLAVALPERSPASQSERAAFDPSPSLCRRLDRGIESCYIRHHCHLVVSYAGPLLASRPAEPKFPPGQVLGKALLRKSCVFHNSGCECSLPSPPLKAAFRKYLELAFRISVVNFDTAQKGTSTE